MNFLMYITDLLKLVSKILYVAHYVKPFQMRRTHFKWDASDAKRFRQPLWAKKVKTIM